MGQAEIIEQKNKMQSPEVKIGDLHINRLTREVRRNGQLIPIQNREFLLLEYLSLNKGEVVTREMLLQHVWNYNFDPQTNLVDVHISRLRSKIDKPFNAHSIETVRGQGYRLVDRDPRLQ